MDQLYRLIGQTPVPIVHTVQAKLNLTFLLLCTAIQRLPPPPKKKT